MQTCLTGAVLVAALIVPVEAAAFTAPWPVVPLIHATGAPATVRTPFAGKVVMGQQSFDLATTQIRDIVASIGSGAPGQAGTGADSYSWVCYTVTKAKARISLAGAGGRLDSVSALASNGVADADCPALPDRFQPVAVDGAIWLGMSEADLIARLGKPSQNGGDWLAWHRRADLAGVKGHEDDGLAVRLENGKVAYFEASRRLSQ